MNDQELIKAIYDATLFGNIYGNIIGAAIGVIIGMAVVTPVIKLIERIFKINIPEIGEHDDNNSGN